VVAVGICTVTGNGATQPLCSIRYPQRPTPLTRLRRFWLASGSGKVVLECDTEGRAGFFFSCLAGGMGGPVQPFP
jgi:hypothetical protein